jgi:hypothetical protein
MNFLTKRIPDDDDDGNIELFDYMKNDEIENLLARITLNKHMIFALIQIYYNTINII